MIQFVESEIQKLSELKWNSLIFCIGSHNSATHRAIEKHHLEIHQSKANCLWGNHFGCGFLPLQKLHILSKNLQTLNFFGLF